ncbi:MAG: TIGR01212 family radical SAM protein [bacterium]
MKSTSNKPYYTFSTYLRERFGCRVHKVNIDAGFSCPNRDGTKGTGGCIYCDNRGFSHNSRIPVRPVDIQIQEAIEFARKRFRAEKFMAYFQAYSNTYAKPDVLRKTYDSIRRFDDIVALAIGTRPDCVDSDILDVIGEYTSDYELWMEYGLQSIHERTLEVINRHHSYADFEKAVHLTREREGIKICAHVILGLPGETVADMIETARALSSLKVESVKIHPLHVVRGTRLEELYNLGEYKPMEEDEYVEAAVSFLEHLSQNIIIQRLSADCPRELLAAPSWMLDKNRVLGLINETMIIKRRTQGSNSHI